MTPRIRRLRDCFIVVVLLSALSFLLQPSAEVSARRALVGKINADSSLKLYEGLPHPRFDAELFKSESMTKPTTRIHSDLFYESEVVIEEELENQFRALCKAGSTYQTFRGEKLCGGFHADYALRWSHRDDGVMILMCFNCEEAWLLGDNISVRVDLSESAAKSLIALLAKTRSERPHPEQMRLKHKGPW